MYGLYGLKHPIVEISGDVTDAYLIIVTTATTGGGVPFSSRRTSFHRERKMDCFQESLFR